MGRITDDNYDPYNEQARPEHDSLLGEITSSAGDIRAIPSTPLFLYLVFLVPATAGFLFGYDIGGTSNAFLNGFGGYNLQQTFGFSDTVKQWVVSMSLVGAIVGSLCCFAVGDFLSRRGVIMMAGGFFAGGALITGCSIDLSVIFIGRFIYGVGIGFAMHSAPLYIAEISPSHLRGKLSNTHRERDTHTHTHTQRERERQRQRDRSIASLCVIGSYQLLYVI
jgi:hypothetical protein